MAGTFEPKVPVNLEPPKDDPITLEELAQANGKEGQKAYVAIKASYHVSFSRFPVETTGKVYDVTGNKMYQEGSSYHVFVGKDASRALGKTSTKPEDVLPEWQDLSEKEKGVLNDWVTFFSKRYNVFLVEIGTK
ncbi:cytochrome b5 [Xylaria palmicola]|nr:cytochrome b5 [Xylaria palmicola]